MKVLIAALVLVSSPLFVQAYEPTDPPEHYISWCEGDKVMAETSQGALVVRAICDEKQTCQTFSRYQAGKTIFIGSCVDNVKE